MHDPRAKLSMPWSQAHDSDAEPDTECGETSGERKWKRQARRIRYGSDASDANNGRRDGYVFASVFVFVFAWPTLCCVMWRGSGKGVGGGDGMGDVRSR
jgi:hypothetical protein